MNNMALMSNMIPLKEIAMRFLWLGGLLCGLSAWAGSGVVAKVG